MRTVVIDISNHPFSSVPVRIARQYLCAAERIFQATDSTLRFAHCLVDFAFGFELGVARQRADAFLYRALGLVGRALDSILVHLALLRPYWRGDRWELVTLLH